MKKISKNFNWGEFKCKDGTKVPGKLQPNTVELVAALEVLRYSLGGPSIIILSGYRTVSHNERVGGSTRSLHLKAQAADIKVEHHTPRKVADKLEELIAGGHIPEGGIGIYEGWVHYDTRGTKARWNG
jgi:uncharacterized protein YcbK (DUF882 family)